MRCVGRIKTAASDAVAGLQCKTSVVRTIRQLLVEQMPVLEALLPILIPKKVAVYHVKWFGGVLLSMGCVRAGFFLFFIFFFSSSHTND
jgi:hypothetical protein